MVSRRAETTERTNNPSKKHEDFELALLLQAAALKFSNQQPDRARRLLDFCQSLASPKGNPVQGVVHYFAKAIQERIIREIGGVVLPEAAKGNQRNPTVEEEAVQTLQSAAIVGQYEIPFSRVSPFTAIQAIVENVGSAKRIHLVDLGIKSVSNWPMVMQALADRQHECPLELLKITAVGVGQSKESIEEIEMVAETNTSIFADRFNSALSFYTALFNCLEDCMGGDNGGRTVTDGVFMWEGIQNLITTEGEEMIYRKEGIEFWRVLLTRFGMIEIGLSDGALSQANMLVESNPCWRSCTLDVNGKGLVMGWKGTPMKIRFTIWKFDHE
ncbi:hypothetical protein ACH5RR_031438 [Cinchona calisaya]|uniref:Uncharacterized protein n=1 Tax=Cinchona calisaya TaxID=153742 RepID=A0ABD2YGL6_9GENT